VQSISLVQLGVSFQIMPSVTELRSDRAEDALALEEDNRLLGRILGDTVRDQEGADVSDLVESIR
jgi:phosphoenolpyruvate carboxylase